MKFNICNKVSGVDLGDYEGADKAEAMDAMAKDAGYKDYRDMCATTDPEDLDAEVERQSDQLLIISVA